jgi:hypothetical protein
LASFPRRHKAKDGNPCPGNIRVAEWVDGAKCVENRMADYDRKRNATEERKTYVRNKMRERRGSFSANRTMGL